MNSRDRRGGGIKNGVGPGKDQGLNVSEVGRVERRY